MKEALKYLKSLWKELIKPENVVKYLVYGLALFFITLFVTNSIRSSPAFSMECKDFQNKKTIRFVNEGNKAGEHIYIRVYSENSCDISFSVLESNIYGNEYNNMSWFITPKDKEPYNVESIHYKTLWETGRDFSLICQKGTKIKAIIGGDNVESKGFDC